MILFLFLSLFFGCFSLQSSPSFSVLNHTYYADGYTQASLEARYHIGSRLDRAPDEIYQRRYFWSASTYLLPFEDFFIPLNLSFGFQRYPYRQHPLSSPFWQDVFSSLRLYYSFNLAFMISLDALGSEIYHTLIPAPYFSFGAELFWDNLETSSDPIYRSFSCKSVCNTLIIGTWLYSLTSFHYGPRWHFSHGDLVLAGSVYNQVSYFACLIDNGIGTGFLWNLECGPTLLFFPSFISDWLQQNRFCTFVGYSLNLFDSFDTTLYFGCSLTSPDFF